MALESQCFHYRLSTKNTWLSFNSLRAHHLFPVLVSSIMYLLSKEGEFIETVRPSINKVKFKSSKKLFLKSPLSRGIILWDWIRESIQKSTTKVKCKRDFSAV